MKTERDQQEHQLMSTMPYLNARLELNSQAGRANERLIAEAEILRALVADSSVDSMFRFVRLSPVQESVWGRIDFTKLGIEMKVLEMQVIDDLIAKAVINRLQRANTPPKTA
jgi:hypothetical protein